MRARKINIYLNPNNESHARVIQYLESSNLSTTEAVVAAVLSYLQGNPDGAMLIEAVKSTIQACMSQHESIKIAPPSEESAQNSEINQDVNDFLAFFKK